MKNLLDKDELTSYAKSNFLSDVWEILKPEVTPETPIKRVLILLGCFLAPAVSLALWGFVFAYQKLKLSEKGYLPTLNDKPTIVYASMFFFAIGVPIIIFFLFGLGAVIAHTDLREILPITGWLFLNFIITWFFLAGFGFWQLKTRGLMAKANMRNGTARFATESELEPYKQGKNGIYVAQGITYSSAGHITSVAGTRGGKGVCQILPNLLGMGGYEGSWVVLDPKGENAAVSGKYQKDKGQTVVYLNPWGMLGKPESGFNPFDLFDASNPNLVDDIQLISEAIVPYNPKDEGASDFFNSMARSFITGLMLHIVTNDKESKSLATLWKWLRLPQEKLMEVLADMFVNDHQVAGGVISSTAHAMGNLMSTSEKEFASIMSSAQKWTNFLGSPALQKSLAKSDFDPMNLSEGKTTLYIMIPPDRLKTHFQWLRLIISTLIKSVVRKPNKKVTFLLDEAATLGYLSEIETALGAYAGYNLTIWSIFQDLNQIKKHYGDGWETFMGNCSVKTFFNVGDNFSAEYLSKMFGKTSIPKLSKIEDEVPFQLIQDSTERDLITMDELRRRSGNVMFTIIDSLSVAALPKVPYYTVLTEGVDYEPNPYFKPS